MLKIYKLKKRYREAKSIIAIISQLYPDSPDEHEAKKISSQWAAGIKIKEVSLINLNDEQKIKERIIEKLRADLKLSSQIEQEEKTNMPKSGLFVQLGYYSSLEYAK